MQAAIRPSLLRTHLLSFLNYDERRKAWYEQHVQIVINKLHAVLSSDDSANSVVCAYHASFYDFLKRKAAEAISGWERPEVTHIRMFQHCIGILSTQPRFDICKIEKPVLNKDIPGLPGPTGTCLRNISEDVQYSS